ncbi:MAG: hypothetical protein A2X12_02225 [Bacteroidetes bacterium GWE2_29_8]|nr:MAG: hypothetical protein A2X12_02225 [Bacteroidetes bacterium GWE2_29_8]OFY19176.1 MAG: hypothetical protein A2X02_01665 [Bacteroidetes bacterium GWF2_29_10]
MTKKIAKLISFLFHPLLIPSYVVLIMLFYNPYLNYLIPINLKITILSIAFILSYFIPGILIVLMKKLNIISSIYIEKQEERNLPLLLSCVSFYSAYYILKSLKLPFSIYNFLLIASALTLIALFLNLKIKISLHSIGIGAFTAFVFSLKNYDSLFLFTLLSISILLSGLILFARLKLNNHNLYQVVLGYFLGFLFSIIILYLN